MYRRNICVLLLCVLLATVLQAAPSNSASKNGKDLSKEQYQREDICCLPVYERYEALGFCYLAQDGYMVARIEDDALRDTANKSSMQYPICKDAWCRFDRGLKEWVQYVRIGRDGRVLSKEDKKFEKDVIGFVDGKPSLRVYEQGQNLNQDTRMNAMDCEIGVNFNVELLDSICAMKNHGNGKISYVRQEDLGEVGSALSEGDFDSYVFFYDNPFDSRGIAGLVKKKYMAIVMNSDFEVSLSVCQPSSINEEPFNRLGFTLIWK